MESSFRPFLTRKGQENGLQGNSTGSVIELETWKKWGTSELVADEYELKSLVQDWEGLTLVFLGRKTEVSIAYHAQILSFCSCDEGDRWKTVDTLLADHGKDFFQNWLAYQVSDSRYASWFAEETFGTTAADTVLHLAFVTANDIVDVLSLSEPTIFCREIPSMTIREYRPGDCREMAALFYDTVHTVNARYYTPEQLDAWADGRVDLDAWDRSFRAHTTLVAVADGRIVGFGDMAGDGYLDRLYVHKDWQGRGVATALCDRLEAAVPGPVETHASITARPFF